MEYSNLKDKSNIKIITNIHYLTGSNNVLNSSEIMMIKNKAKRLGNKICKVLEKSVSVSN